MNALRYFYNPKVLVSAIVTAAFAVAGFLVVNQNPASAANCTDNDVIKCGYSNPTDLANKVAGSGELQTLYNYDFVSGYGIGDLDYWKAHAQHATVYKDGRIILDDGYLAGTGAYSLGRKQTNGNKKLIHIGNNDYFYGLTTDNFAGGTIGGYALLNDDDHSLQFLALTPCANPIWTPNSPAYKCKMLSEEKVDSNTFKFTTEVFNKNATLTKLVYEFGDGATQTVTSDFGQAVTHDYAPGSYTARVTAFFSAGGQEKSDTRASCTKPVEVPKPPVFECTDLHTQLIEGKRSYEFTVTAHVENGAKLLSADFTFGDGTGANDQTSIVKVDDNTFTITVQHKYADKDTGKKTITADLEFDKGEDKGNARCEAEIELTELTCKDTPNAPECQPPKTCKQLHNCKPKTCKEKGTCKILPSTGPTDVLMSGLGISTLVGAGLYYRNSRRSLLSDLLNK